MNRSKYVAIAALTTLLLGGCSLLTPKLDFSNPETIVYTTRLGLAQTYDVLATGIETGKISKAQGTTLKADLDRGVAALQLAETALAADQKSDAADAIDRAINILTAVRTDPALSTLIAH